MFRENDFYYSAKAFQTLKVDSYGDETVNEAFINNEWQVFTEQILKGREPLSKAWGDLIYIGSDAETRSMRCSKWLALQESKSQ
ncbi:hypothetical protein [Paenibacillus oleatilyticus]|uniref:hypothetical protein n=1 Tax=Paenibacillus oleatilyticus TaxID=2594886 RepID=UPI001C200587|nr:hypothetical protein [Paenibacillus oleatilyticus]MBU7316085.1 hypothetical protein [Paenibacillus oleatilyticus]